MATALDFITPDEAKDYLRVDYDDEDTLITSLIKSCVQLIEDRTEQRLYQREEIFKTNKDYFTILSFPVNSIVSVKDKDGADVEFDADIDYVTTLELPCDQTKKIITADVGYTAGNPAPETLKEAVLKLIEFNFNNRGNAGVSMSDGVQDLIAANRRLCWF